MAAHDKPRTSSLKPTGLVGPFAAKEHARGIVALIHLIPRGRAGEWPTVGSNTRAEGLKLRQETSGAFADY
jgi:hypothetical protein